MRQKSVEVEIRGKTFTIDPWIVESKWFRRTSWYVYKDKQGRYLLKRVPSEKEGDLVSSPYLHRRVMNVTKRDVNISIRFRNGNSLDVRQENLEEVGREFAFAPYVGPNSLGYRGVTIHSYDKRGKPRYVAKIYSRGAAKYLGMYKTAKEASEVYEKHAKMKELGRGYLEEKEKHIDPEEDEEWE